MTITMALPTSETTAQIPRKAALQIAMVVDQDGINDAQDQCPQTASGASVNNQGCANSQLDGDDDLDGIRNNQDTCPHSPPSEAVNSQGCAQRQLGASCFTTGNTGIKASGANLIEIAPQFSYAWTEGPAADAQGKVYFTDPCYDNCALTQGSQQVYLLRNNTNTAIRLTNNLVNPNGIIGTPDGKVLYVSDAIGEQKIFEYRITDGGLLDERKTFANIGGDGMSIDCENNIYIAAPGSSNTHFISVRNSSGIEIERINLPETPSNITFGEVNHDTLFITAFTSVYSLKTRVKGMAH